MPFYRLLPATLLLCLLLVSCGENTPTQTSVVSDPFPLTPGNLWTYSYVRYYMQDTAEAWQYTGRVTNTVTIAGRTGAVFRMGYTRTFWRMQQTASGKYENVLVTDSSYYEDIYAVEGSTIYAIWRLTPDSTPCWIKVADPTAAAWTALDTTQLLRFDQDARTGLFQDSATFHTRITVQKGGTRLFTVKGQPYTATEYIYTKNSTSSNSTNIGLYTIHFWFAPGVGLIAEYRDDDSRQWTLVDYTLQ